MCWGRPGSEGEPGPVYFADGYEGVTVAGVLVVARDSGTMLLAQRAMDPEDDPEVQETWEMPGGHLESGEEPFAGAAREFEEEIGVTLPIGAVTHGWRAGDEGQYQGFVYAVDEQFAVDPASADPEEVQNVMWVTPEEAGTLNLRPEFAKNDLTALVATAVSGNEDEMTEQAVETDETEPEFDPLEFVPAPIPVHGVLAPEGVATGDGRGFSEGSVTRRPLRLPLSDQRVSVSGHDGSVVTGSVDRLMRRDGLIHWEGSLMPSEDTEDLIERMVFFDGRFGVSVDGDNGVQDAARSKMTNQMWFESVRASGLTAVAIPAFHEAYIAFGTHPDMPDDDTDAVLAASGLGSTDIIGARPEEFRRGPGWVTNPTETRRIHAYWTKKGQPGYAKIGWGTPGDWRRAKALIGEKIAKNSPEKMRFLNQIISQWHFDALGYWPGELGKPGNPPDTKENRRRAARHAASSRGIELAEGDATWEAVLTSSAGSAVYPPLTYFHNPFAGEDLWERPSLTIHDPDTDGVRRVTGYAAEWGVCHIGYSNRCVEPPRTGSDDYPEFHLGLTRTSEGHIPTGVLTYGVEHRDAETILRETPEQAYFDNVANAWAAVRLGEDERGIWFSGVVLPGVPEEDLVAIQASGQVSGEWKYGALRACLAVNVPGYPVRQATAAYDENGNVIALAASAFASVDNGTAGSECDPEPTPVERIAALAKIDAETRMDSLREKFNWVDVAEDLMAEAQDEGRVNPVGLREDGAIVYEKDGEIPGTDIITDLMPASDEEES